MKRETMNAENNGGAAANMDKKPMTSRNAQLLPQSCPGHFILIVVSLTYLKVRITNITLH